MTHTAHSRWRSRVVIAALVLGVGGTGAAGATPEPATSGSSEPTTVDLRRPMLAFATENHVVVVDRHGRVLSRVPRGFGGFSLGGDVLAKAETGTSGTRTVVFSATSGDPQFRIEETLLIPTVAGGGRLVAFSGQGDRDPYATSLWTRNRGGRERKLIQFSFGGSPGVPTGISEGLVLEYSFSHDADRVAVAAGDDIVGFEYDIWAVDVATRDHTRLTTDHRSRFPSMSPSGARVAYFREDRVCGGPMPGYRGGDLLVVDPDRSHRRRIYDGTCQRYLDRARWLTDELLVASLHTRRPGAEPRPLYDSSLVLIDTDSRTMSSPISMTDRVGDVSVSPSTRRVAYTDWTAREGFWVYTWKPSEDENGWSMGTTRRFPEGRVPHLRDDMTQIPSY